SSIYCILRSYSMDAHINLAVIIWFRFNQTVETVAYLTITHYNNPNTAHAGRKLICSLKIYCCETLQYLTHIFNITIPKVAKKAHRYIPPLSYGIYRLYSLHFAFIGLLTYICYL